MQPYPADAARCGLCPPSLRRSAWSSHAQSSADLGEPYDDYNRCGPVDYRLRAIARSDCANAAAPVVAAVMPVANAYRPAMRRAGVLGLTALRRSVR